MRRYKSSQAGFTLMETAIVIFIGGVFIIAALFVFRNYTLDAKTQTTQSRMRDVDAAIMRYLNTNGVLPCPAAPGLAPGTAKYGKAITDPFPQNDCYITAGTTPGMPPQPPPNAMPPPLMTLTSNTAAGEIVTGAVPVFSLGLPAQDIADAWGNLFTYAVTDTLTKLSPNEYDPTQGAIIIEDLAGNDVAPAGGVASLSNPAAQYVIVSYGANGAGSYTTAGKPNGIPCPAAPALENTNCNTAGNGGVYRESRQFSKLAGAGMFDDFVIYHALTGSPGFIPNGTVAHFALPPDPLSATGGCPTGWTLYTGPVAVCTPTPLPPPMGTGLPPHICCQKIFNP